MAVPHSAMTPAFPFSPAVSQALAGSSPHANLKKSPHSSALAPSLSSSGLQFGSPASSTTGTKYLSTLMGIPADAMAAAGVVVGGGEDKERSKLKRVLKILKTRPGKISEEGVKRVARRAGMQYHTDSTSVKGVHTLIISGSIVVVDIDLKDGVVSRVALSFAETPGPASEFADRAAKILEKTVKPESYAITSSLASFADNLERFARSDRLSCLPSLNCFSAVTGLYVSMMKIWEKEAASMGEVEAMCKGMGRPGMHLRGKVGFCIDYWKERRMISSAEGKGKAKGDDESGKHWRVVVDINEVPNEAYITPVRNSEDWVSDNVLKGADALFGQDSHEIDWIEPPLNNYESVTDADLLTRLNCTRFIAKLDPPVVVGLQDEVDLLSAVGASTMSQAMPGPLESIFCPKTKGSKDPPVHERKVYFGKDDISEHTYNLNTLRPAYGRVLEEVPFSHPRQLAAIFQILRKYACFDTIFHTAFPEDLASTTPSPPPAQQPPKEDKMDLDAFLSDDQLPISIPVDISMNAQPLGLSLLFPCDIDTMGQVEIHIMNNADLQILAVTGQVAADGDAVKKVVEVTEDIGILVEWVKRKSKAGTVAVEDGMVE